MCAREMRLLLTVSHAATVPKSGHSVLFLVFKIKYIFQCLYNHISLAHVNYVIASIVA